MAPVQGGQLASICLSSPLTLLPIIRTHPHHTATAQRLSLPADSQSTEDLRRSAGRLTKAGMWVLCSGSAMNVLCNCQKEPTLAEALIFLPAKAEGARREDRRSPPPPLREMEMPSACDGIRQWWGGKEPLRAQMHTCLFFSDGDTEAQSEPIVPGLPEDPQTLSD